jgi:hypothetical protein
VGDVKTLKVGDRAYITTGIDRVPCVVTALTKLTPNTLGYPNRKWTATVVTTAARAGYRKHEEVTVEGLNIYPRECRLAGGGHLPYQAVFEEPATGCLQCETELYPWEGEICFPCVTALAKREGRGSELEDDDE